MKFLNILLNTKPPQTQRLLDVALVLSLVPHLFALEGFVVLYLLVAFYFIFKKKRQKHDAVVLFGIGSFLIALSFFNSYNFADFSRMQFFVSLVSSVLILAISLQRLVGEINFYLKLSPALLMLLSFFFFDTIAMLFYSLFVFFVFVLLNIWSRMDAPLSELLRFNGMLFLLSLPAVVVLFIAFPRISFEKAEFGFRAEGYTSGAFNGSMYVSDSPFVPRNKVVMELFFKNGVPKEEQLYFRGSVLYPTDALNWEPNIDVPKDVLTAKKELIEYDMLLHAHGKQWFYSLDMPTLTPVNAELQNDTTLRSKKELYESKRYTLKSALHYTLKTPTTEHALDVNASVHPKTAEALRLLGVESKNAEQKAAALMAFFASQRLAYTAKPKNLDMKNPLDSFLFEAKNGYCTHFASSFAISARLLGIPSRVVSGYKADYESRVENYLVVKQKDAHAWVELYLGERGWVRFEPTASAFINLDAQNEKQKKEQNALLNELSLHYMYAKYLISNWILGFDRLKQIAILESLLSDTLYLLQFVGSLIALVAVTFFLIYIIKNTKRKDRLTQQMQKLQKLLEKRGFKKEPNESMESFLLRSQTELKISLESLKWLYLRERYSHHPSSLEELKEEIKKIAEQLS